MSNVLSTLHEAVLAALGEGVVVHDRSTRIVEANDAATRILGLTRGQLTGRTSMHPEWRALHDDGSPFPGEQHPAGICLATGRSVRNVVMGVHKPDGSLTWILVNAEPIFVDDPAAPDLAVASFSDITSMRNAMAAQAAAEHHFKLVAENSADFVVQIDIEGRITWASPSMTRVLGYSPDEFIGHSGVDFLHPDDVAIRTQVFAVVDAGAESAGRARVRLMSGQYHWFRRTTRRLLGADGQLIGRVSGYQDIDSEVAAEEQLAASESRYRVLAENVSDIVLQADLDLIMTWVSPSVEHVLGFTPDELVGRQASILFVPEDVSQLDTAAREVMAGKAPRYRARFLTKTGEQRWMEVSPRPLRDEHGKIIGRVSGIRDIDDEVRSAQRLEREVNFDALTGLAKKPLALEWIQRELKKNSRAEWGLLCAGVNRMTAINQTFSHRAGDEVLKFVADRLVTAAGGSDRVARIAGDEFVLILPEAVNATTAARAAERVLTHIGHTICVDGVDIDITACVGIATAADGDAENLLRDATAAMRQATAKGAGRWDFLDREVAEAARSSLRIQSSLRTALEADQVHTWLMPIVDLATRKVVGHEALARWVDDDGTIHAPDQFLRAAEQSRLIVDLDMMMLRHSIELLAADPHIGHIAVNISGVTLHTRTLDVMIRAELGRVGVAPQRLHLEVTETALINVTPEIRQTMQSLADLGIMWWVDDFGTGFSSVSHLHDLPVQGLKLDISFTSHLTAEPNRTSQLARGLAGLASGLGLSTVAEGIESEEQATALFALGWHLGQGYLFGQAEPTA